MLNREALASGLTVLDLFSAAAGGWSLGMHRAGFRTIAACEVVDWRRAIYSHNNPGVPVYDDVCTLTAERLLRDLGELPAAIVGSPPCQDISSANTKGKGVDGERSGLFFEAVRLIGEIRPRWYALENSANLRTRGADRVIAELEALGYTCWPTVVRASDIGANHERPRCWLIGCDIEQVADADGIGWQAGRRGRGIGIDLSVSGNPSDATSERHESGRAWRYRPDGNGAPSTSRGDAPHPASERCTPWAGDGQGARGEKDGSESTHLSPHPHSHGEHAQSEHGEMAKLRGMERDRESRTTADPDQARQAHGCLEPGLRQEEIAHDGCGDGRRDDRQSIGQMAVCAADSGGADGSWPLWSLADLASRLRLDDGLPARMAGTRIAVGGKRGTSAANLIVEAYGDAVVPQIPEAIGRAILRVERAMSAITGAAA